MEKIILLVSFLALASCRGFPDSMESTANRFQGVQPRYCDIDGKIIHCDVSFGPAYFCCEFDDGSKGCSTEYNCPACRRNPSCLPGNPSLPSWSQKQDIITRITGKISSGDDDCWKGFDFIDNGDSKDIEVPMNRIAKSLDDLGAINSMDDAHRELKKKYIELRKTNDGTRRLKIELNNMANFTIKKIADFQIPKDDFRPTERCMRTLLNNSIVSLNVAIENFQEKRFEEIAGVQISVEVIERKVKELMKKDPSQTEVGTVLIEMANTTIQEIYDGYRFLREEYPLILKWLVLVEQTEQGMTTPEPNDMECSRKIVMMSMMNLDDACQTFMKHAVEDFLPEMEGSTLRGSWSQA